MNVPETVHTKEFPFQNEQFKHSMNKDKFADKMHVFSANYE